MAVDRLRRVGLLGLALVALGGSQAARAAAGQLTVLVVPPFDAGMKRVVEAFRRSGGADVVLRVVPPAKLAAALHGDDHPDAVVADAETLNQVSGHASAAFASRTVVARAGLGMAAARDAAVPDLSSTLAVRTALAGARVIAVPEAAANVWGQTAMAVLKPLDLPSAVVVRPSASLSVVAFGEADLGIHAVAQILQVPSVKLLAPLPAGLQQWIECELAVVSDAPNEGDADHIARFLKGMQAREALLSAGLEPAP